MSRHLSIFLGLLGICVVIGSGFALAVGEGEMPTLQLAQKLQQEGNIKEASEAFLRIANAAQTESSDIVLAMQGLRACMQRLGDQAAIDGHLKDILKSHPNDYRVLSEAAAELSQTQHQGVVADQIFSRGYRRGYAGRGGVSGRMINVSEQDRLQALKWLVQAIELAKAEGLEASDQELARLYLQTARELMNGRQAWQLQSLTDLDADPNYLQVDGDAYAPARKAPVDENGNPVFYASPASWDVASSDGERYRWALDEAAKSEKHATESRLEWARFLESQFSVSTMADQAWFGRATNDSDQETDGRFAIHTLTDDETIAKLANGVKRFELPEEFNFIRIYQSLPDHYAAVQQLANVYLNRRQYKKAATVLQAYGEKHSLNKSQQNLLDNILQPRFMFETQPTQLAGQPASVRVLFRNATDLNFTARRVDMEKILADTKAFFRGLPRTQQRGFGGNANTYPPSLSSPQQLFSDRISEQYLIGDKVSWTEALEPLPDHWDRRVDIKTPITKAGLYLIEAEALLPATDSSHPGRYLLWVQDSALVRTKLSGNQVILDFLEAASGKPIANATVEMFGIGHNGPQTQTKNFATKCDANGRAKVEYAQDFQWLTIARTEDGRFAFLDMEYFWAMEKPFQSYSQTKAYGVSDRPVYRPGDTLHTKFWFAKPSYGLPGTTQLQNEPVEISLNDSQGNEVYKQSLRTDEFGACGFDFELPKTLPLGRYSFNTSVHGVSAFNSLTFSVEEYRKPEFEVEIVAPEKPVALGETIKARVKANYYFGAPVTEAEVIVKVQRSTFTDSYYPSAPFDWCYGPGYWWFTKDYRWYPGWTRWFGCIAPRRDWSGGWWGFEQPELVLEQELTLNRSGEAVVEIDSAIAKSLFGDKDHKYTIDVEVRDASRRTQTAQGTVIAAREPFKVYTWLNRGYVEVGDRVDVQAQARTLTGTAVVAKGRCDLLRISYDPQGKPSEEVISTFEVETDSEGNIVQPVVITRSGQYRARFQLHAGDGRFIEGGYIFTVRGEEPKADLFTNSNARYEGLELVPDKRHYAPGESVKLQIASDHENARVYVFLRPEQGVYEEPKLVVLDGKTAIFEIPVTEQDQPNFFVEAYTVFDGEIHQETREIYVPPADKALQVEMVTDKEEYEPGETSVVQLVVRDLEGRPVRGSSVIAAYDRSLDQIAADSIPGDIREFFWKWRRNHNPQRSCSLSYYGMEIRIPKIPYWQFLGIFGRTLADDELALDKGGQELPLMSQRGRSFGAGMGGGMGGYAESAMVADAMMPEAAPMLQKSAMAEGELGGGQAPAGEAIAVRKDFADSALWLASITTDENGQAEATFQMPENLTGWQLRSWSVAEGTRVGSATARAVTRKPLLIRLQQPRFVVERDEVVISAIVHNDLGTDEAVAVTLEIEGETQFEFLDEKSKQQVVNIQSGTQARVDWRCKAVAEGTVILRSIARAGSASDAMQLELPIVVHGTLKTDSYAGTVRADQSASKISIRIPEDRRIEQSRLAIRLSPSLAAAMMDALPYMAEYPYGCTEQTLNRFLPTVLTQRVLQDMKIDLKSLADRRRNNLNAQEIGEAATRSAAWKRFDREAVFDVEVVNDMVRQGVQKLTDMQTGDGGWGWFSGALERSSPHTTAVVVRGLLVAKQNGVAIVPDVLQRGVAWLEQYQATRLATIQELPGRTPNDLDALVFHVLVMAGGSNEVMQQALFDGRNSLGAYGKTLLALATHRLGATEQTNMLRRNIEQFLVIDDENQTAFLNNDRSWWYWYGSGIESTAMYLQLLTAVEPESSVAPQLVKFLLNNRKHSTYWNSTRDSALVIEAFASYLKASGELEGSVTAEVWLNGKMVRSVEFTPETMFTVNNTIELVGNAVPSGIHDLEIRKQGGGNLYWNAYVTNFTTEQEIEPAGLEVKIERRYYLLEPKAEDTALPGKNANVLDAKRATFVRTPIDDAYELPSGALVEVELLVQSKNDYEYLLIEDRKPAGLEAVETQSGYFYSAGLSIYRELRERHIGLCIQNLPQGNYSIRYQLRSETPGKFTALPAQIQGMYAPELVGNSDDFDMQIVDR